MEFIKCEKCGTKNEETSNFCGHCGNKLKETCNCWIKKSNYNCGESSCPGYGLFLLEKSKEHCESRDRNNKNGNTNPLAAYRVTDDEFEFLEKLYKLERKAFWKGVLIVGIIVIAILVLFHIVT